LLEFRFGICQGARPLVVVNDYAAHAQPKWDMCVGVDW